MILAIYGAGGLGVEVCELALRINSLVKRWDAVIFIDDFRAPEAFRSSRTINFDALCNEPDAVELVIGVGEPSSRSELYKKIRSLGMNLATLIDPTAIVSPSAKIGSGTIICEFTSIHADVVIGDNCLLQPYCCIGHDIRVGSHSVLSAHCAPGGKTNFGNRVFSGMNSSIKEGLNIGDDVVIAMGAAVFQDLPDGVTVVGNPARITLGRKDRKVF